jgi:Plasmid stabilization system protein
MDYRIEWSPTSRLDFRDLILFISEENFSVANHFRNKIINHVIQVAKYPKSGRVVPEFQDENIREIIQKPYRIVYRINKKKILVEIVRIWHSARGIPEI